MYQVIDKQTGKVIGSYQDRKRARRKADKLDLEYGAIRYYVREVIQPVNPPTKARKYQRASLSSQSTISISKPMGGRLSKGCNQQQAIAGGQPIP